MTSILAYGITTQSTSYAMITTVYDIFTPGGIRQSTPQSALVVTTNPTFAGVQSVIAQLNGSLQVNWNAGTSGTQPLIYDIYVKASSNVNVFQASNLAMTTPNLSAYIFQLADSSLLISGTTYYVGVRARDPLGNASTNTTLISAVSVGVAPGRPLTPSDISTIVASVWDELAASHTVNGSFGKYLDAQVSTRATQTSVNLIPTNPLLTTDTRLNTLDVNISTRSSQTSVDNINTKVGTPVVSISDDIAAVKSDTNTINGKVGSPVTTVSGDIAAVQSTSNTINSKIGTPVTTVSGDVAAVKSDSAAIKVQTDKFSFDGSNYVNAHTILNDDKTNYTLSSGSEDSVVDKVWNEAKSGHTTSGTFGESNQGVVSITRANNLDFLDATITSRASQVSVDGIQNNTNFIGVVPEAMVLPDTGSKDYILYARLFNNAGAPNDPDSNIINISIKDAAGATVVASTAMTRTAVGNYEFNYTINSTDPQRALYVFFDYVENSVSFNQVRNTEVQEFESKLDTLLARLTATRANNLDYLDVAISSRSSQTSVDNINTKIGTPVTSVSGDIAAVQTTSDTINTKVGTPVTSVSGDIAAVKSDTGAINTKVDVNVSTRATQASVDAVPTAGENADAVWDENVNDHATGTTTARTLKDAKIFSQIDL